MHCHTEHPQHALPHGSSSKHSVRCCSLHVYSSKSNRQSGSPFQAERRVSSHLSHSESLQDVAEVCVSRSQAKELAQLYEGITQAASISLYHLKHAAVAAIPELKSCVALDAAGDSRLAWLESQAVQDIQLSGFAAPAGHTDFGEKVGCLTAVCLKKRTEKTAPFGVNLMRSQVLYRAAQGCVSHDTCMPHQFHRLCIRSTGLKMLACTMLSSTKLCGQVCVDPHC